MRSRVTAWTLAGIAVLTVAALAVVFGGIGDETVDGRAQNELGAAETSVTEASPATTASTTATTPPPTTTTTDSTTSTMTTTSVAPDSPSGYTPAPNPAAGPDTVAPGGALTKHLAGDIATAFGFTTAEVEAAIAAVRLPPEAGGNPEGWLAPGTYDVPNDASAAGIVQAMVDRRVAQLELRDVPRGQWHRMLTAASVIEKETYNQNEKPRVARVLTNRLAGGGPLQMDSIILYPVPEDRIFTTR
ncbi:MAG: endolytic transglycosylase MltG, partial [Acidimicrobiia bacterium]|nr:endolytic transglycosylase MltG [Acidimicrobiia bacterium]